MKVVANSHRLGDVLKGKVILGFYTLDEELMIFYNDNTCSILRYINGYGNYDFVHRWYDTRNPEYIAHVAENEFGLSIGDVKDEDSLAYELNNREKHNERIEFNEYIIRKAKFEHGIDLSIMFDDELVEEAFKSPVRDVDKLIFDLHKKKMEHYSNEE